MDINTYIAKHVMELDKDYAWKMPRDIPSGFGIKLNAADSLADQSLALRQQLAASLRKNPALCDKVVPWYIATWGGVRGNKAETMQEYVALAKRVLGGHDIAPWIEAQGMQGIASWSKALSLVDPARFAILDARVAISLNVLLDPAKQGQFPRLTSRNKMIVAAQAAHRNDPKRKGAKKLSYQDYLTLLKEAAQACKDNSSLCRAEMVLFADAERLAKKALGKA